jgi:hypothetical protein
MQITDAHRLRDGTFDARTNGIGFFEGRGALPLTGRLQRQLERLWTNCQGAGSCLGTLPTARADQTSSSRKLDRDDLLAKTILGARPCMTQLSSRAPHRLALPITGKMAQIEAACGLSLPTVLQRDGAQQLNVVLGPARHDGIGIHIAPIHHMRAGEAVLAHS